MKLAASFIFFMLAHSVSASEELVIVAKPISAALSSKSCNEYIDNDPDSKLQEVCMDRVFNVSYQVLSVLSGNFSSKIISGIDFYHYTGLPDHMIIDPVCVTFNYDRGEYIRVESVPAGKSNNGYICEST
ncbi:hypothetical protein [Microbulbifer hydrolyticus]|uniref:Uncharacterized protein n=1 Tax=Microbulbifer hydrolyticus TaxID=48074 RepID=A0A6P1TBR2_9GAMM|nr:hypothetical protein [Microbulbifer hydrolyticus]MBB5210267.1 hypothetical protein [Microbulbifer hydrolyticus]QHQ39231.1 hypothetical protein GTQ55_09695 [Microbulbifer hydrolyticus]